MKSRLWERFFGSGERRLLESRLEILKALLAKGEDLGRGIRYSFPFPDGEKLKITR